MRALVFSLLLWLCAGSAPAQGIVVAIGGALQEDNAAVWRRVVELAGGPGARFVVLAQGSQDPQASARRIVGRLEHHGAVARAAEDDAAAEALLAGARGVFLGGGDQTRLVQALAGAGEGPLLRGLRSLLARGGVVAGTSAGAAALSRRMFVGGEPLAVLQGRAREVLAPGLGFVRADLLIDQHFIVRGRVGRLLPALLREGLPFGLGVDEDSAAVIRGSTVEVLGTRGALFVDTRAARPPRGHAVEAPLRVDDVSISWLEAGDRLDIDTGVLTPAPHKRRRVGPGQEAWQPYHRNRRVYADLLAGSAFIDAAAHLVDSPFDELRGLSFDAAPGGAEPGFEWIFSRAADTAAWSAGYRYTISRLRVAVHPVRMARPLFAY
jgi:cyanophycinase